MAGQLTGAGATGCPTARRLDARLDQLAASSNAYRARDARPTPRAPATTARICRRSRAPSSRIRRDDAARIPRLGGVHAGRQSVARPGRRSGTRRSRARRSSADVDAGARRGSPRTTPRPRATCGGITVFIASPREVDRTVRARSRRPATPRARSLAPAPSPRPRSAAVGTTPPRTSRDRRRVDGHRPSVRLDLRRATAAPAARASTMHAGSAPLRSSCAAISARRRASPLLVGHEAAPSAAPGVPGRTPSATSPRRRAQRRQADRGHARLGERLATSGGSRQNGRHHREHERGIGGHLLRQLHGASPRRPPCRTARPRPAPS